MFGRDSSVSKLVHVFERNQTRSPEGDFEAVPGGGGRAESTEVQREEQEGHHSGGLTEDTCVSQADSRAACFGSPRPSPR